MIVNLTEKTIGLPEDMKEKFDYTVTIKKKEIQSITRTYFYYNNAYIKITNNANYAPVTTNSETETTVSSQNLALSDSQLQSFLLYYCEPFTEIPANYTNTGNTITVSRKSYPVYYQETTTTQILQTIEIRQSPKTDYLTVNDAKTGDKQYQSADTSETQTEPVVITYTT